MHVGVPSHILCGALRNRTMFVIPVIFLLFQVVLGYSRNPTDNELHTYAKEHEDVATLTTTFGKPVSLEDASDAISSDKELVNNIYLMEALTHLARERIPPRVVHADGAGAKGYFKVTHDVSKVTNVKVFNKNGKKIPVLARFATSVRDVGAGETFQGNRGSAFKFYTEEGNMDLTALVNPVFAVKNPADGASFVHILKANPRTNMFDSNMLWDFYYHHPEAIVAAIGSLSARGRPDGYRNMIGYCIHTFQVENDAGEEHFIKLNWVPVNGIKNLTNAEGDRLCGKEPDYATADLYNAIERGDFPKYTLNMQVIPKKDVKKIPFDIFDITLGWPMKDFPNQQIGELVLNENPDNYQHYVEMVAFNPTNLPQGMRGVDKLIQMRSFLYREAAMHRLGPNYNKIKANCPLNKAANYDRNGAPPIDYDMNLIAGPNYYPSSFNGPQPVNVTYKPLYKPNVKPGYTEYHYEQAGDYYRELSEEGKEQLIENAISQLKKVTPSLQQKCLKLLSKVDESLGATLTEALAKENEGDENCD